MDWHCHGCHDIVDEHVLQCPTCGAVHPSAESRPPEEAKRDGRMESHLRAMAMWLRLGGCGGVAVVALMFYFPIELSLPTPALRTASRWFLLGASVAAYFTGHHLERYSDRARGWAGAILMGVSLILLTQLILWTIDRSWTRMPVLLAAAAWTAAATLILFHPRAAGVCTGLYRAQFSDPPPARRSFLLWFPLLVPLLYGLSRALTP